MSQNCCNVATIVAWWQRSMAQLAQAVEPNSRDPGFLPLGAHACRDSGNRQPVDCPQPGPLAPFDLGRINGKRQFGPAPQQRFERASAFDAGELMAEAEVNPGAESDMAVRPALQIEPLGVRIDLRIHGR